MMQNTTFPQPVGAPSSTWNDARCREWLAANVPRVSYVGAADGGFVVAYADPVLSLSESNAIVAAFAAFVAPPNVREADAAMRESAIRAALVTIRSYPAIATPTTAQRLAFERAVARVVGNMAREMLGDGGAD